MQELNTVLAQEYGLDLTGWNLERAYSVSEDGRVIVGRGWHNGHTEAWRAEIPEPATMTLLALGLGAMAIRRRKRK